MTIEYQANWAKALDPNLTGDAFTAHLALHEGTARVDVFGVGGTLLASLDATTAFANGTLNVDAAGTVFATGTAAYAELVLPGLPPIRCRPDWNNAALSAGMTLNLTSSFTFGT
jgi:hypothetical protein